jgi:hypothetical protein
MYELKVDKVLEETEKMKQDAEKIDIEKMIKEAIESCLTKGEVTKLHDDKEELLNLVYTQTIKNYVDYVKNCTIIEAKKKLQKEIEEYNKNIKSILIKSENEIKEYKNKYLNILEENNNLKDKIYSLTNYNRVLLSQIHSYQTNLDKIEKNYENISKQKILFDEMLRAYPGKNPPDIIKELENMKDGAIQLLQDYQNISLKLQEANDRQKKIELENRFTNDKLVFENKTLIQEKNALDDKYSYKINTLEHRIADNEEKGKENQFLKNTIFHIYNLLFKEFALNRNLKIDNKYIDIRESDFNPNFFYDNEIKNYIKLMIKTMHHSTYDVIFRETMGYLNMILRLYLPNKMSLRFQPAKAFKEIKDFIDLKMGKIEGDQKIIEKYKQEMSKKENEIFQMQQDMTALNKEYNFYKKIVDKEFEKTNRIIFQLNNNKERTSNKNIKNINKNRSFNSDKNNNNENALQKHIETDNNLNKLTTSLKEKTFKMRKKSSITIKSRHKNENFLDLKGPIDIMSENNVESISSNRVSKTVENYKNKKKQQSNKKDNIYKEFIKIKKSGNEDKIIKENGNQETVDKFNNIRFLINETNRLFLYKPKMNSTQDKIFKPDKHHLLKTKIFKDYNDLKMDLGENIKKKIFSQINHLIISSKS